MITLTREEAQQVLDAFVNWDARGRLRLIETLRARLAEHEKEQEPVAWTIAGEITNWSREFSKYRTQTYVRPVYTTPPQREWQGLTYAEIEDVLFEFDRDSNFDAIARAIEAKLKEKNR